MSWLDVFKPKPLSRSGYLINQIDSGTIGTGGLAVVASSTVSTQIPVGRTKVSVLNLAINWLTAAAGSSTITVQVFKVSSGGTATALCAATSIKNDVLTGNAQNIALPITSTLFDGGGNATRVIDGTAGDSIRVDIVDAGTITTQPLLTICAEVAVLQ